MNRIGGSHQHQHQQQHRRGRSLTGVVSSRDTDENNLDLFSRTRRTLSLASSDESDGLMKLSRVSVGSLKLAKSGIMDDLLSSVDGGGKNDYDWLLTPPGTPLLSDASEGQQNLAPSRNSSSVRSASNNKTSRLSVTQSENSYPSRPTRSSSVTRSSVPSINYNSYSSNSNRSSSILNTSSASVTSISRPSTPNSRSTLTSATRSSTPTSRVPSRPSTPVRSRPNPSSTFGERTRTPQSQPRPSTPTSRPQTPSNSIPSSLRSNSRPSTPTRRSPSQGPQLGTGPSVPTGRVIANGRSLTPASRGSSPGPRARPQPQPQPVVPPDFPLDTPPNLRTTMPNRPVSAGRSRPSTTVSARGNSEPGPANPPRRQSSSPIVARGRLPDLGKGRLHGNGHNINAMESQKTPPATDPATRRPAKSATSTESTGFGRTISKKSLDMALRHMDIRQGSGNIRPSPGSTIFPQSIRGGICKGNSARVSDVPVSVSSNGGVPTNRSTAVSENGNCNYNDLEADTLFSARVSELDIYESSRYDAILLKEDSKNTNWLLSEDDKSDQGFMFGHRFESLPEPFDPFDGV